MAASVMVWWCVNDHSGGNFYKGAPLNWAIRATYAVIQKLSFFNGCHFLFQRDIEVYILYSALQVFL